MKAARSVPHPGHHLCLVLLGLIGSGIVLLATSRYGAGISPDSVGYIATARHIANGDGVIMDTGTPLIVQPPLYPALLASIDYLFGVDPLSVAHFVSSVLFGLIVYLSGLVFFKYLSPSTTSAVALAGAASVLVSWPLIETSTMAWSETLFICFILLYLIQCKSYVDRGDVSSLLLLSLSVAFASLTRYIGVILIPTGIITILLFRWQRPSDRFRHLFLFTSVSALPIGIWVIRNYFLSGTLLGPRSSASYTFFQNCLFILNTMMSWYLPVRITTQLLILLFMSPIIVLLIRLSIRENRSALKSALLQRGPLLLLIFAYVSFLLMSSTSVAFDQIGNRLLSPVLIPTTLLLLLFVRFATRTLSLTRWLSQKSMNIFSIFIIGIWLTYPLAATRFTITIVMNQGQGYSGRVWKESQTIEYLQHRTVESGCTIYSNGDDVIYILTGVKSKPIPERTKYNSPDIAHEISSLRGSWPEEGNVCLIWFDNIGREYLFTVDELRAIATIQPIIRLEDGAVYTVRRK